MSNNAEHRTCVPDATGHGVTCGCGLHYFHLSGWLVHRFKETAIPFNVPVEKEKKQ